MKKSLIILIIGMALGAVGMYFALPHEEGAIDVGKPAVSETHYNKPKTDDYTELKERTESPINITGEYKNGNLGVDAFDSWKSAHADFPISCGPEVKHHIFGLNYYPMTKRINPIYYYNLGNIALGGGLVFPTTEFNLTNCEINIGILYQLK